MYLNEEAKEMLIDFILEQDESKRLDNKYAGFEGIIIALVDDGVVTFPHVKDDAIESYLIVFDFVDFAGYDINGTDTVTLKIKLDSVAQHDGFIKYVEEMKLDTRREIKQLEEDADELRGKLSRMSALIAV